MPKLVLFFVFIFSFNVYSLDAASCRILQEDTRTLELSLSALQDTKECSRYKALQFALSRIHLHYQIVFNQNPDWSELENMDSDFTTLIQSLSSCKKELAEKALVDIIFSSHHCIQSHCSSL
jgi:hypothetical protein